MNPRVRRVIAAVFVLLAVGATTRLGFWQLGRAAEKRAQDAARTATLGLPPLTPETGAGWFEPGRRVVLRGVWDRDLHVLLSGRTYIGAAGVHVVTPLVLPNGERVLVERGWLAAPDARVAHPETWPDSVAVVSGVTERFPNSPRVFAWAPLEPRRAGVALWSARSLDSAQVAAHVQAPLVFGYVRAVHAAGDTAAARPGLVAPSLALPESGERMHLSYAIQWFSVAVVIVVAAIALARRRSPSPPR